MDNLSNHAGKMIEIMNNRRNHYRSLEDEISDIAEAVYHLIIRLQVLELGIKDMRGDSDENSIQI